MDQKQVVRETKQMIDGRSDLDRDHLLEALLLRPYPKLVGQNQ